MPEFRWILLFTGLVIIAAVYFLWGRKLSVGKRLRTIRERLEPALKKPEPESELNEASEGRSDEPEERTEPLFIQEPLLREEPAGAGKIVVLHLTAPPGERFDGASIVNVLKDAGLEHGHHKIFHRVVDGCTWYSVANMVKPGTFDPEHADDMHTRGISLFSELTGSDGVRRFNEMLETAHRLAEELGGVVKDETGSSLTLQTATFIQDDIVAFEARSRTRHAS